MDIELKHIKKSFKGRTVIADFSASFKENTASCIMGPSGCGKTTLLSIIMGLFPADSGEIYGIPQYIAAVFQEDRLCEEFSAFTNVKIAASKDKSEREIRQLLSELGLKDEIRKPVQLLSGGMKRRVAIARAMAARSSLLIMDEPFNGLDAATRNQCISVIKKYNGTIIFVSHDAEEANLMEAGIYSLYSK